MGRKVYKECKVTLGQQVIKAFRAYKAILGLQELPAHWVCKVIQGLREIKGFRAYKVILA
jgi:hypothetical protein